MDRIILHCDCNCFYASCELLSHPDLRQLPVAVCGDPTERHGIILAKNEPAKRCGVKTAETIWKAKQKCPGLILLPPHHRLYAEYSKKINAVYGEYTDLVEPFGIDESWLDVTNSLHLFGGDARALADTLRGRIKREFGLTISVGVSFNKVFAKLGSDYKKPNATTVIARDNWRDIVFPLPVGDLLFVGRSAQELLGRYGVRTIGELSKCSEEMLETLMGKMGSQLYRYANGLDDSPVRGAADREPIKSVGNSTTFRRDLTRWDEVQSGIFRTGLPFGFQNFGVLPDIVTMAKGIASGVVAGACAAKSSIAAAFAPGDHGTTFGGSNIAMAAAHVTLSTLLAPGMGAQIESVGAYMRERLARLPHVQEVRGFGLMNGIDLTHEAPSAPDVVAAGLEAGLVLNATGPHTLRFLPPLICTEADVDVLVQKLEQLL